jgi:hypothetical protein
MSLGLLLQPWIIMCAIASQAPGRSKKIKKEPSPPLLPGMLMVPAGKVLDHTASAAK